MGARYYAAWLGRWTSADPMGIGADGPGLYNYTRGSPVVFKDPGGMQQVTAEDLKTTAYDAGGEALAMLGSSASGIVGGLWGAFGGGGAGELAAGAADALDRKGKAAVEPVADLGGDYIDVLADPTDPEAIALAMGQITPVKAKTSVMIMSGVLAGPNMADRVIKNTGTFIDVTSDPSSSLREVGAATTDTILDVADVTAMARATELDVNLNLRPFSSLDDIKLNLNKGDVWDAAGSGSGKATLNLLDEVDAPSPSSPTEVPLKFHYTNAPERSFQTPRGLWANSSVTDQIYSDALTASQELGIPLPDKIIPIVDVGQFVPNKPPIVQPSFRFRGGGNDFTNPQNVPPQYILPARRFGN